MVYTEVIQDLKHVLSWLTIFSSPSLGRMVNHYPLTSHVHEKSFVFYLLQNISL